MTPVFRLCSVMLDLLPKLTGEEMELLWTRMEEIVEQRRRVAIRDRQCVKQEVA